MRLRLAFQISAYTFEIERADVFTQTPRCFNRNEGDVSSHVIGGYYPLSIRSDIDITRCTSLGKLGIHQSQLAIHLIKRQSMSRRGQSFILAHRIDTRAIGRHHLIRRIRNPLQATEESCLPFFMVPCINFDAFFLRCGITAHHEIHILHSLLLFDGCTSAQQQGSDTSGHYFLHPIFR